MWDQALARAADGARRDDVVAASFSKKF